MTRVLITGDRRWSALHVAETICRRLVARYGSDLAIVHGGASTGVDAAFEDVVTRRRIAIERHAESLQEVVRGGVNFVVLVHRSLGRSRLSRAVAELAIGCAIPVYLIADNDCRVVRVLGFSGFEVRVAEKAEVNQ